MNLSGQLARRRRPVLQAPDGADRGRPRRRRPRSGPHPGPPRRRARGSQRASLGPAVARLGRVPPGSRGVGRPGRGDRRPVADYVLSPFAAEDDVETLVGRAADAVETLAARRPRRGPAPLQLVGAEHPRERMLIPKTQGRLRQVTRALQEPFGAFTSTVSPTLAPTARQPSGESVETPPATLEISTSKRPPLSSSTSTTEPTPTTPSSACSTMTAFSIRLPQDRDPALEQALLVLRVVVGEVLGEVAEPACGRDRLDHLRPLRPLELGELGRERVSLRRGHRLGCALGHGCIMADFAGTPHTLARR